MADLLLKDNFNGFADNCKDMGNSFELYNKQSESEKQKPGNSFFTEFKKVANCQEASLAHRTRCTVCKCDSVIKPDAESTDSLINVNKSREMQANWIELHKCIRFIYKNAISSVPCVVVNEEVPKRIADTVKVLIKKLYDEDCQQLFIRVEVLVKDFVLEARDRLKDLQSNVEDVPVLYLRGLLASYGAFCVAADNLTPFISQLDALLMKRFSINFQLLNKYLFQTCLYADSFVQNNVPLYISQLRSSKTGTQSSNQELVHSYLAFDDEMTDIASRWLDVKKLILKLSKKRVISNCNQPVLFEDRQIYREHRDLAVSRTWQHRSIKRELVEFDVQLLSLLDDITNHMCKLDISSNIKQVLNTCRNCNLDISCSCDDCTIKHILNCVDTPPLSPDDTSTESTNSFNTTELLEQFRAMSKVNKIQMPKNFLKLITDKVLTKSFVQNCEGDKPEVLPKETVATPKSSVPATTNSVLSSNATPKVPASSTAANSINNSNPVHSNSNSTNIPDPTGDKSNRALKDVTKATQNKPPCNHTYQVQAKKTKDSGTAPQGCKDGCIDHGPVKNQKDSKRCDCPHCEVFENSNVQNFGKNNKTRDRLRNRLNEKRNKALKEKTAKPAEVKIVPPESESKKKCPEVQAWIANHPSEAKDTRNIKDLIDFIEGTDRNAKLINAEKRLAKKARRRERKLEEERLKEEERLRIEAERLLEEQRKLQELKRQEELRLREQQQLAKNKKKNKPSNKSKEKGGKMNHNNATNQHKEVDTRYLSPVTIRQKSENNSGPMVTIKRVMEHSTSEPTVTITLKGSTPDKDKLLYTLVNGQTNVGRKVEEPAKVVPPVPLTKTQKKKAKKEQQKLVELSKQPLSKKERKKLKNDLAKSQAQESAVTTLNTVVQNESKKKKPAAATNSPKPETAVNLQMLRLPPGITITKVDGPTVNRKTRATVKNDTPVPVQSTTIQSTSHRSGVIVVDTVKLKEVLPSVEQQSSGTATILKKKKKKNKSKSENANSSEVNVPEPLVKTSNTSENTIVTIKNPMFYQLQESLNGKINKPKVIEAAPKEVKPQQASIIKGENGMVTIRSPRLNGNVDNRHNETIIPIHNVGNSILPDLKPVLGPNSSLYKHIKKEKTKPFNAQEILSGLPGIEITKINKNVTRTKNETKLFQPADVSIIPTNLVNGTNGDVYKLFSDHADWSLESVFAPKDIKEDEELDADELELEAFKRFCQQSVPPERKEKVAHLNVKDIVLKKKTSSSVI